MILRSGYIVKAYLKKRKGRIDDIQKYSSLSKYAFCSYWFIKNKRAS